MTDMLRRIASATWFQNFVTLVIVLAGIVVGVETYPTMAERFGHILHVLDKLILGVFVAEVVIKIGAEGRRPWRYFQDPWNIFDFSIVAATLLPLGGSSVTVLRLLRLLRVLRLFKALPRLQMLVGALLKSIPSMFYVTLLLMLLFYVYAVAATLLFAANDPVHFGSLHISMLSLFRVVTLEGWTELLYIQMYGCAEFGYDGREALCTQSTAAPVVANFFFLTFILFGTMIILNLFVGVIMKGMEEAAVEADMENERERTGQTSLSIEQELELLETQLRGLQDGIARARRIAAHASGRVQETGHDA